MTSNELSIVWVISGKCSPKRIFGNNECDAFVTVKLVNIVKQRGAGSLQLGSARIDTTIVIAEWRCTGLLVEDLSRRVGRSENRRRTINSSEGKQAIDMVRAFVFNVIESGLVQILRAAEVATCGISVSAVRALLCSLVGMYEIGPTEFPRATHFSALARPI
jgi:hypothetical protein